MAPDEEMCDKAYRNAKGAANILTVFWKTEVKAGLPLELSYNNQLRKTAESLLESLGGKMPDKVSELEPTLILARDATEEALQYASLGKRPNCSESEALSDIFFSLGKAIYLSYREPLGPKY